MSSRTKRDKESVPEISQVVQIWDEPWMSYQLRVARGILRRRGGLQRDQHDTPWFIRLRSRLVQAVPLYIIFACLLSMVLLGKVARNQNSTFSGLNDPSGFQERLTSTVTVAASGVGIGTTTSARNTELALTATVAPLLPGCTPGPYSGCPEP